MDIESFNKEEYDAMSFDEQLTAVFSVCQTVIEKRTKLSAEERDGLNRMCSIIRPSQLAGSWQYISEILCGTMSERISANGARSVGCHDADGPAIGLVHSIMAMHVVNAFNSNKIPEDTYYVFSNDGKLLKCFKSDRAKTIEVLGHVD